MVSFEEKMQLKQQRLSMTVWEDVAWYIDNINVNVDQAIQLVKLKYMREMIDDGLDVNQLMP